MRKLLFYFLLFTFYPSEILAQRPYVEVLGIAQDAGYPQAGCQKECCESLHIDPSLRQNVASIALVNETKSSYWIFDATPDFTTQNNLLHHSIKNSTLGGIFLTHAHIGHYTGLVYLGREAMSTSKLAVFARPKMKLFLENNGPWSQLVTLGNIELKDTQKPVQLNSNLKVESFLVPHRDEFSETVGYKISSGSKSLIYIPDIDKWSKWEKNLADLVKENDYLLLDGTFFKDGEINRPMSEVPHPFVSETMEVLNNLTADQKSRVYFIHFNHTNPLLSKDSAEYTAVTLAGFNVSYQGLKLEL